MSRDFIGYVEISVEDLFNRFQSKELIVLKPPPKPHKQEAGGLRVLGITHYDEATPEGKVRKVMATCSHRSDLNKWLHFMQIRRALNAVFAKLDKNKNGTLVPARTVSRSYTDANVCPITIRQSMRD